MPDGMVYVPMSCQSEGALQVFVEPVVPVLDLLVVGRPVTAAPDPDAALAQILAEIEAVPDRT